MSDKPSKPFKVDVSSRISRLPPYLFGRINKMKYEKRVANIDIIDLGMGNPTDPTPKSVVDKLSEAAVDPRNHRYSVSNGIAGLRREVAKKYSQKYGVELARRHNVMIISDFAYGEICFDGYHAPSFLSVPGAKEVGVEFTTMSKSYNMAGWRVGFCAGNAEMVKALATIKGYYDYGMFAPIQIASIIAMRECAQTPEEQAKIYQVRRDEVCRGLDKLGWTYERPRASMFVWAKIKPEHLKGEGTIEFCLRMMDEAEVALAPGRAFGEQGEGNVRIALVENEHRLRQAMRNLDRALNPRQPKRKRQAATA